MDLVLDIFRPWIEGALPDLNAVINRFQPVATAPRPAEPYADIYVPTDSIPSATTHDELTDTAVGSEFVMERSNKRVGTLRVSIYGIGAEDYARELQRSVRAKATRDAIAGNNQLGQFALRPLGSIVNLTELRETSWDPHAQVDFAFMIPELETENVPDIQQLNLDYEISGDSQSASWVFADLLTP